MSSLARAHNDVLIGVASAIVSMIVSLAVVPVYIRILGVEAYGLVGFLALLQGIVQILDLGFAPTISREVARAGARGTYEEARPLLASLSILYWLTSFAIGLTVISASRLIATHWLHPKSLSGDTVRHAVMLIGIVLAARWPAAIYNGTLIGAHRLTQVSLINLVGSVLGSLGALGALQLAPKLETLFVWQASVSCAQLIALRWCAWNAVGKPNPRSAGWGAIRPIWRFSAGMAAITLIAIALTQLDRLLVSKMVSLAAFGLYTLASVIGRALYGLVGPMYNVIYPRFTAMLTSGEGKDLEYYYKLWTNLFCSFFFPASMAVALVAKPFLRLWTHNPALAENVAPVAALIVSGSALHAAMYFPFALQVASGDYRRPLLINITLVVFYVPVLVVMLQYFGILGAALAWFFIFLLYLLFGTWITHKNILRGVAMRWLTLEVGAPLVISITVGFLAAAILNLGLYSDIEEILVIASSTAFAGGSCFMIVLLRHREFRDRFVLNLHSFFRRGLKA